MPIQAPQWTEFLSCPVCYNVFNEQHYRPISLACGHTVCRTCLSKFQQKKCPFDQSLISRDLDELPSNFALLQLVCATASPDNKQPCVPQQVEKFYDRAKKCVEDLALLLKPVSSKEEGRARALRAARSLGERTVTELILQHQNPQQLSSNLWAARLEAQYPQASKTAIGHVVQLLYRASCFKLKEDYRTYEMLRREHDSQIVQIAMEAGLRIAPDQWSSLLYGDATHKSHMQSIIDKPMVPAGRGSSSYSLLKRQPSSGHQAPRGVVEQPHPGGDAPPGLGSGVPPTPGSYPTRKMEVILPPGAVMQPNGSLVPAAPNAPAGFVAPIDNTVAPAVGMENVQRVGFLPPNGDSAILQSGGIITGVESQEGILFQQQGIQPGQVAPPFQQPVPLIGATGMVQGQQPPGMVQPNSANMAGAGQQMVGPGFGQANPMAGNIGQPGMPQQGIPLGPQQQGMPGPIQQMSGMMPPYMSPYGPGGNMMGPRFPMHPMMYGQYPYPAMHPYMHYYPQGYMAPDGSRMPFDPNYFQSLNPFAEPWKPNAQGQMPSHMMNQPPYIPQGQGHGADVNGCEVCSQKMKEEEKKKQENRGHSHLCNQHYKNNSSPTLSPENQNVNYANLKGKELDTESKSDFDKSSLKEQRQILKQSFNRNNSSENWQKESQNSVKDTEETPAWSTFDDEDNDNDADYDYETSTRQFEQDRPQFESRGQNQDEYSWQAETSNSASETGKQNMSDDQSRTHPPPMLAEPNAKLYSLHSLHEKRNSLIQQLQEINKETIEQEQKLEELNNMPNLFKFDTDLVSEAEAVKSTLQHPAPLDTGPAKLKSNKPTNGEIFERLGAISGVLPRSVNDSILASWTTSALHDLTRSLESPQITPPATPYSQASSIPVSIMSTVRSLTSGSTISSHSSHFSSPFSQTITRVSSNNGTMSGIMTGTSKSSSMYSSAYSGGQSLSSMPSMSLVSTSTSQSRACGIVTTGKSRISTQMASSSPSYYTSTDYSDSSPVYNVTNKAYKKTKNIVYNSLSSPASSYENASTSNDSGFPESYSQPQSETYPSKMEEDTIPFVEGSPIISKFGPISRATRSAGGLGSGRALEVVADESAKMIPVTAVTPISSAPVPTSQMVPSRFASSWLDQERREPDNTQTENKTQPTSEVNLLEQKAMKASTEDEKLSVKLHAIQLQITLKEQELEQARSLESQAQTSESHNPTVDSSSTTKTDWN
ncbi:RC3H2-like protein [Mya arenaria]|uniref:RC3H2-like protein n=1 Tax=Mya arenaria TaxID=6604 RepID=A0ABY7E0N9_MYAAR|nr:RC3H2-like protein [Mya arenaria]